MLAYFSFLTRMINTDYGTLMMAYFFLRVGFQFQKQFFTSTHSHYIQC